MLRRTITPSQFWHFGRCGMTSNDALRPSLAPYPENPIQDLLRQTAGRLPDKVGIIDGDRAFTFSQLENLSGRFAAALATAGVAPGDRVGIFAPNCVEFAIAFYGIVKAGAIVR